MKATGSSVLVSICGHLSWHKSDRSILLLSWKGLYKCFSNASGICQTSDQYVMQNAEVAITSADQPSMFMIVLENLDTGSPGIMLWGKLAASQSIRFGDSITEACFPSRETMTRCESVLKILMNRSNWM